MVCAMMSTAQEIYDVKYEVVMKRKTWANALQACRAKPGGDLVAISS